MPRLYLRIGDNEFEADGEEAFVEKHLTRFMETPQSGERQRNNTASRTQDNSKLSAGERTPAEFVRLKSPSTQMERLLVLAKYLEEKDAQDFAQADLNKLAGEAKLKEIHAQFFTNATKQGYLRQPGKGRYALSLSGEDLVASLPRKVGAEV